VNDEIPKPGEWWQRDSDSGERVFICGNNKDGEIVYQWSRVSTDVAVAFGSWTEWTHLPDCTGFDWVPPEHPDDWITLPFFHRMRSEIDFYKNAIGQWVPFCDDNRTFLAGAFPETRCRRKDLPVPTPEPDVRRIDVRLWGKREVILSDCTSAFLFARQSDAGDDMVEVKFDGTRLFVEVPK